MAPVIEAESFFRHFSALIRDGERRRQHLCLLRDADGLRADRFFARGQDNVRRALRRVGIVLYRDGQRRFAFGTLFGGKVYPFFRRIFHGGAPGYAAARCGHLDALGLGFLGGEGKRSRVYRQCIDFRILGTLLGNGNAAVFHAFVVGSPEDDGCGARFCLRVGGNGNQQFPLLPVVDGNPLFAGFGKGVCPFRVCGGYGNLLRNRVFRTEGERRGGNFERSRRLALLRLAGYGEQTGCRGE